MANVDIESPFTVGQFIKMKGMEINYSTSTVIVRDGTREWLRIERSGKTGAAFTFTLERLGEMLQVSANYTDSLTNFKVFIGNDQPTQADFDNYVALFTKEYIDFGNNTTKLNICRDFVEFVQDKDGSKYDGLYTENNCSGLKYMEAAYPDYAYTVIDGERAILKKRLEAHYSDYEKEVKELADELKKRPFQHLSADVNTVAKPVVVESSIEVEDTDIKEELAAYTDKKFADLLFAQTNSDDLPKVSIKQSKRIGKCVPQVKDIPVKDFFLTFYQGMEAIFPDISLSTTKFRTAVASLQSRKSLFKRGNGDLISSR